jgi:hypothetical protein
MKRYIIAVLALFFILATGIVLIAGRSSNGDKPDKPQSQQDAPKQLYDYATSPTAKVVFTTQGKIVGDDQFKSIRITVSRSERKLQILNGYTGRVESSKTFVNNEAAFDAFLRSLALAGFSATRETARIDERGVCPNGVRYIYEFQDIDTSPQRTWSVSCNAKEGNFAGSAPTVRRLFQNQITDYTQLTRGVRLT